MHEEEMKSILEAVHWSDMTLEERLKEVEDAQEEARRYFWRTLAKEGYGDINRFNSTMTLWDKHFEDTKSLILERWREKDGRCSQAV